MRDLLLADPAAAAHLTRDELDRLCDPAYFVRNVAAIYDRVLGEPAPAGTAARPTRAQPAGAERR